MTTARCLRQNVTLHIIAGDVFLLRRWTLSTTLRPYVSGEGSLVRHREVPRQQREPLRVVGFQRLSACHVYADDVNKPYSFPSLLKVNLFFSYLLCGLSGIIVHNVVSTSFAFRGYGLVDHRTCSSWVIELHIYGGGGSVASQECSSRGAGGVV